MKLYGFRTVPLSIIRRFSLHTQQWYTSYMFADSLNSQQTCMTYNIAVCTVQNSWRWTEELSEKRRVSFQNIFEKLVHLVGFIIRNLFRSIFRILDPNALAYYAMSAAKYVLSILFGVSQSIPISLNKQSRKIGQLRPWK